MTPILLFVRSPFAAVYEIWPELIDAEHPVPYAPTELA